MLGRLTAIIILISAASLTFSPHADAQISILADIPKCQGRSTISGFEGHSILDAVTQGISLAFSLSGGRPEVGAPTVSPVNIAKAFDGCSPTLLMASLQGTVFPQVFISFTKSIGEETRTLVRMELNNARVIDISSSAGAGDILQEGASLVPEQFCICSREAMEDGTLPGTFTCVGWDLLMQTVFTCKNPPATP